MASVTNYRNDLFISYSHIDNEPFGPQGGWVDIFHAALQNFVNVRVGRRVAVWRDARLSGAEIFSDQIEQELRSSAVLVSIISPGYLQSHWCNRELVHFSREADAAGQLRIGNLRRVVKVLRLPVARELLPPLLDDVLGTSFYRVDAASDRARDLLLDPLPDAQQVFRARVDDVAHDIAQVLAAVGSARSEQAPGDPAGAVARTVFLGWTTSDIAEAREILRRELEARGHNVVPSGAPPIDATALDQAIRAAGREVSVALYMVGAQYGFIPEGGEHSVIEMQYDVATAEGHESSAPSIVWVAPNAPASRDARIIALLDRINRQPQTGGGWDVLLNQNVETLKALVLDRLKPSQPTRSPSSSGARTVYLMCDQLDQSDAIAIRDSLLDQSVDVRLSLFEGSAEDIRRDHYETLAQCDGVLLYWGRSSEGWLRTMLRDMKKVFGLGRTSPYKSTSIYLAQLPDPKKEAFRTLDAAIIRAAGNSTTDALRPFVTKLSGE